MLKNISELEVVIDGKSCRFQCPQDATLIIVEEALLKFVAHVVHIKEQIKSAAEAQEAAKKIAESQPQG
jgi:hypothetical protein